MRHQNDFQVRYYVEDFGNEDKVIIEISKIENAEIFQRIANFLERLRE